MATQDPAQLPNAAELTPQQIADQIAAQQVGGEPPQLQREYVVQTETGSVFRGRTQQDLIDAMQKSIEHGSRKIKEQDDQLAQYRAALEQQTPQVPQEDLSFNPQRYYEVWAQDPMGAEASLLDLMLQQRYGISLDQFAQQTQQSHQFVSQIKPEVTMRSWMSTSDFPTSNPEELEKAANAFEGVWNEFYPNDFDFTPQKLEQVHAVALKRGLYQPERATGQVETQLTQSSPMPTLNTGTSAGTGQQQDVNRMSPEQIRAMIEQSR